MQSYERIELEKLCSIKAGLPIGRAKRYVEGAEPNEAWVLAPRAMEDGRINEALLATEVVYNAKDEFFTHEGDVVLKLSTPYDSVYIDKVHEGILVTSFGVILRSRVGSVDMRYLAAFLNLPNGLTALQMAGSGSIIPILKKKDVARVQIVVPPLDVQARLAALQTNVQERKELCRRMMIKSDELLQAEFDRELWSGSE